MKARALWMAAVGLLGLAMAASSAGEKKAKEKQTDDYRISAPLTQGNLTIFLIHGKDAIPDKKYLTLAEALEQKKAVVHETTAASV
jgi:hypothetical protein